jgi:hypothetical protein
LEKIKSLALEVSEIWCFKGLFYMPEELPGYFNDVFYGDCLFIPLAEYKNGVKFR